MVSVSKGLRVAVSGSGGVAQYADESGGLWRARGYRVGSSGTVVDEVASPEAGASVKLKPAVTVAS